SESDRVFDPRLTADMRTSGDVVLKTGPCPSATWLGRLILLAAAAATLPGPRPPVAQAQPVLPAQPQVFLDTTYTPPSGQIIAVPGAHHFRFIGIEFAPTPGTVVNLDSLIELGSGETDAAAVPHDIVFDRCYIHGDPAGGGVRGIFMDAASSAVIDSYLSGF